MRAMIPEDLYAINWLGDCDISPDGKRVAYTVTRLDRDEDTYKSAIWMVDVESSVTRQFTAGAKRDSAPRFSPDGTSLAFLSERGEEKPQIFVMPVDGGEARKLTDRKLGAGVPAWSPDSKRIAFSAKTGTPPDPDPKKAKPYRRISSLKYKLNGEGFVYDQRKHLFVVDVDGGELRQLTDGDWDDTLPAWSPNGAEVAFVSARHETRDIDLHADIWVVEADGSNVRRVTETNGDVGSPSWSPDGKQIAHVHTDGWPANPRLRLADASGGNLRLVDEDFDRNTGIGSPNAAARIAWLGDGGLLTVAEERGASSFIVAREGNGTRRLNLAERVIGWYAADAGGKRIAFTATSLTRPAELFLVDLETGDERQLTQANNAWLEQVSPIPAEHFAVPTAEGVEVDYWIMKPAGFQEGKQYPIILNVHGGPFGQYGHGFFDEFQVYAGAGYGVVFCNPRGSSGQTTAFAQALVGDMGGPDYHDVMAAFDAALERMPWADQSRLGVMGGSYGGFMTSWIIGHTNRFKAAISERAVNDWYLMQGTSDIGSYFNQLYLGENATIQDDLDAVLRQSPITYAKEMRTPVLILHSEDDWRCPVSQAEQLYVTLKQLGRDVEFVRFPDENHELSRSGRPGHRTDRFGVILEYWRRKL